MLIITFFIKIKNRSIYVFAIKIDDDDDFST